MEKEIDYAILQLSDLHIFENTEWNIMKNAYSHLSNKEKIKCVIITGDLHQYNDDYSKTMTFLNNIVDCFKLSKKDIFIVPGNHDSESCENKKAYTSYIENTIEDNPDSYCEYFVNGKLIDCFSSYDKFIRDFYSDDLLPYENPEQVQMIKWQNKINFIHLNTAINSNGDNTLDQIVDVYKLSDFYEKFDNTPSIIIAHHAFNKLHKSHQHFLTRFITDWKVSAYLCGDTHKMRCFPIMTYGNLGENIPCIVCGKSAPETFDSYSDLACILYLKEKENDNIIVSPFTWDKVRKRFMRSNIFDSDSSYYYFPLIKNTNNYENNKMSKNFYLSNCESIWLPDAEKAKGTQARFDSFTKTSIINTFISDQSPFWGISAVKGIGKTFVLQVKRRRISKNKLCLPIGIQPSVSNGWGTESVVLQNTTNLNSLKSYNNTVLLWEYCISVYVINQLVNLEKNIDLNDIWWDMPNPSNALEKKIKNFFDYKQIDRKTNDLCKNEEYSTLDNIINYVLQNRDWVLFSNKSLSSLYLLQRLINTTLKNIKKESVVVFIDKVDQSIRQTSSEPPPNDCSTCWKKDTIMKCKNKNEQLCNDKNTSCRYECCYGCEKYETPYSNTALRVYGDSNKSYKHVNLWQYIQLGLVQAVDNLRMKFGGIIEVYFTIREEAYSCEIDLWGDNRKKIASLVEELWYTKEQQQQIYNYCIQHQQEYLLFNPTLIEKEERLEEAFVGVKSLCHPFAKELTESVFDSIYRHSFDRSRDIQEFGEYITSHMDQIRQCNSALERGEFVKKLIEDKAADLAFYCGNHQNVENSSYYVEKLDILPNFWAKPENFKKLITMFSRNLMFGKEVKKICKKFNNIKSCKSNCEVCSAQYHPFSMLYKLGMLGQIKTFPDWKDKIEIKFLHSKQITYITGQNIENISNDVIYVLHPALTKSIEHLNIKILHFNGFIIGKGLSVSQEKLKTIIFDYNTLSATEYTKKYFFKK